MQSLERQRLERQGAHVEDALNASLDDIVNTIDDLAATPSSLTAASHDQRNSRGSPIRSWPITPPGRPSARPSWPRNGRSATPGAFFHADLGRDRNAGPTVAPRRRREELSRAARLAGPGRFAKILGYDLWTDPARSRGRPDQPRDRPPACFGPGRPDPGCRDLPGRAGQHPSRPGGRQPGGDRRGLYDRPRRPGARRPRHHAGRPGHRRAGGPNRRAAPGDLRCRPGRRCAADRRRSHGCCSPSRSTSPYPIRRRRGASATNPLAYRAQLWHWQIYTGSIEFRPAAGIGIQAEAAGIVDRIWRNSSPRPGRPGVAALGRDRPLPCGASSPATTAWRRRSPTAPARSPTSTRELTVKATTPMMADTAKSRLLATLSHELRTPAQWNHRFTDSPQASVRKPDPRPAAPVSRHGRGGRQPHAIRDRPVPRTVAWDAERREPEDRACRAGGGDGRTVDG